jgi:hypothetical protein
MQAIDHRTVYAKRTRLAQNLERPADLAVTLCTFLKSCIELLFAQVLRISKRPLSICMVLRRKLDIRIAALAQGRVTLTNHLFMVVPVCPSLRRWPF